METGRKSLDDMAKIMNEWALKEIHGKREYKLRAQTVNRIFRPKFYTGILTSSVYSEEVKGQHVPMITEQQFYKVQAILDGRNVRKFGTKTRAVSAGFEGVLRESAKIVIIRNIFN